MLATVDLQCTGMCDSEYTESTILNEIQTTNRLGSAIVLPDRFMFMAYGGKFIY